ncbi:hypothetical protein V8F20_006379 [Naviculisporaceae sp. PSN 640]
MATASRLRYPYNVRKRKGWLEWTGEPVPTFWQPEKGHSQKLLRSGRTIHKAKEMGPKEKPEAFLQSAWIFLRQSAVILCHAPCCCFHYDHFFAGIIPFSYRERLWQHALQLVPPPRCSDIITCSEFICSDPLESPASQRASFHCAPPLDGVCTALTSRFRPIRTDGPVRPNRKSHSRHDPPKSQLHISLHSSALTNEDP